MCLSRFSIPCIAIVALTLLFSVDTIAEESQSSLSGQVVDMDRKPVVELALAIKPVEMVEPRDMVPRTPSHLGRE